MTGSAEYPRVRHAQAVLGPLHVLQEAAAIEQQDPGDAGVPVEAGGIVNQIVQFAAAQAQRVTGHGWARFTYVCDCPDRHRLLR